MQFAYPPQAHSYYYGVPMPATLSAQTFSGPSRRRVVPAPAPVQSAMPFVFGQTIAPPAPRFWLPPAFTAPWTASEPYHLSPLSISDALPDLAFPPSPTDSYASSSPALSPPPIVSAVPLLAPRPLPFHSPRFLQFDDLPDMSEDLSHAPYVRRPKRKRTDEDVEEEEAAAASNTAVDGPSPAKRPVLALPASRRNAAPVAHRHYYVPAGAASYAPRAPQNMYLHAQGPLLALRC